MDAAINLDLGELPELQWVHLSQIRVDSSYQRPVKKKRIAQILRDFRWAQFGALQLVDQGDGTFTVYDGQHRFEAARLHPSIEAVPCVIVRLDQAFEEAQSFLGVNINRSAVSTVEKYWAGIEAGDEMMMRICSVLEEAGCEVVPAGTKSPAPNRTSSISAIQRSIERYGEEATTEACRTLVAAWPKDNSALAGVMIQSLARLYRNNKKIIDRDRMITKLHGKDRKILAADANAMQRIGGGDGALSLSKVLVEAYNKGLQLNQIQIGAKA
ncbi:MULTISPECIES: DUF6551 family protein [unclassified Rhizobium]|uniref:DUF6551 family protein n=1 Tax=unclassified Rhizobium TaxID=2613769 RepID=UPI001614A2DC|nr:MULTISPECIES: DUF6551 family protein [unclassified Rhizobium]MBB3386011.1 hypothetical protein [Rhizobium sp. BK098]MBB3617812.1 hypothetical protein [Rhizobium sp. BK609]MBB3683373.1 hypothetical protein [Rhizobium sp. BK612]